MSEPPEPKLPALRPLPPAGGRLLVATTLLADPNFSRTVIYLLEHDEDGTVGVIVNRPSRTPVGHVLPSWQDAVCGPPVVFGGGPVQPDGALCLGLLAGRAAGAPRGVPGGDPGDDPGDSVGPEAGRPAGDGDGVPSDAAEEGPVPGTRPVVDGVATIDLDADAALIAAGTSRLRVFAGHAGWSGGQLGAEIAEGAWWVVRGGSEDLFSPDPRPLWSRVLRRQPSLLSLVSTYPLDPRLN